MSFRRVSSAAPNTSTSSYTYPTNPQPNPITNNPIQHYQPQPQQPAQDQSSPTSQSPSSPTMRKRPRTLDMHSATSAAPADGHPPPPQPGAPAVGDDAFINDQDAVDSAGDDDDDDEKPKSDKKAGRRKIKIEFIQDKSRRHITFSKRKAGKLSSPINSLSQPCQRCPYPGIMKKVNHSLFFFYFNPILLPSP
jgi:pheromone receptor transcription factor